MRRIAAALLTLAMGLWSVAVLAAPVPTYPLTPPPYNSTAALLGSQSGQVINFPLWAPGQTLINGTPVPGHCSIWVTGTNGLQLGDGGSGCGAGGTVSSVGLTMPEPFACSGSPVTTSGTIICTIDASPNTVLAGPPTGSGGGTNFRALVTADLPNSGVTPGTYPCLTGVISAAGTITDAESNMCGDVSVYFGTGAPSTIYSQGDLYFDVSETPFNTYVQYFGTGTSPSQEGSTSATCCAGTTTSVGAEISTSSSNLLLAYVINYSSTPTVIPVAGITDTNGHTFHKYTSAISGNANQTDAELWCATISGPNASDTVTATFGTATNAGIALIGIENAQTGANCATASFDANGSWPVAINGGSPTSATISTNVPNDLVLFAVASSSSGTGIPSGFTSIYNLPGSFHSPSAQVGAESLSAVWSSQSVSWPTPTDNGPVIMAAIAGNLGSQQWFQYGNSGLSAIGADELLANITGSSAVPVGNTLTSIIDAALCSTRGAILERGSSGWGCIAPGTSTYVLTSNGSGADPSYQAASGGGSLAVQQGGSTIVAGATTLNFTSGATVTSGGSGVANVAVSGGGGGWAPYSTTTVTNTTTASETITIPSGYNNIKIICVCASNGTDGNENRLNLVVNSDVTQSDYSSFPYYWFTGSADGSGFQSGASVPWSSGLGYMIASTSDAASGNTIPTDAEIDIFNYNQSSLGINIHGKSWMSNAHNARIWESWFAYAPSSLAAITSVTLSPTNNSGATQNFQEGSIIELYVY